MRGKVLTQKEKEYLNRNRGKKTAEEFAKELGKHVKTIKRFFKLSTPPPTFQLPETSIHELSDNDRRKFFQTTIRNSKYYDILKDQFSKDEIDFYLEEWATLCLQFEDILATEKRQIDELIKSSILGNRILRNIKIAENEIVNLQDEIKRLRKSNDVVNDENAQERDQTIISLIKTLASQVDQMTSEYQNNVTLRNKILDELKGRRKDRIEQLKKSNTTFLGLVAALREQDIQEKQGKHAELLRLAKEKKKDEWRKPTLFPDGSRDCILIDEHTQFPENNLVVIDDTISKLVYKYQQDGLTGESILIIDDDLKRIQFFQTIFQNHVLDYASNATKAIEKITDSKKGYSLICFDYDLGMDQKSIEVAKFIINKDLFKDCNFLIHTMNNDGANLLTEILIKRGSDKIERVNFEKLLDIIKR